jgi:tetratricopeptide (TPR) repeat protein
VRAVEAEAAYARATKAFQQRALKRATVQGDKCTQIDPSFSGCFLLAGDAYAGLRQESKAIDRYRAFLRLAPSDRRAAEIRRTLKHLESTVAYKEAGFLFQAKRFQEALSHAVQCLDRVPDSADCHLLAGTSADKLGQREPAAGHYRKVLEIAPEHKAATRIRLLLSDHEEQPSRAR